MIFSMKKPFAQWLLNDFFNMLSCDSLQIDILYAIQNVQSMFRNFFIHIGWIVFSRSFFETDWVESIQCDDREILRWCD